MDEGFIQLKWNTHQLALLNTLSTLRDKQVYTDVTLSCGDQFYPAHRLVLSACSTFFARTLEVANCRSPMLLLHGIEQSTLEQLLMFMYDGQVTISRNDLANLVKAAQWLGVKGLDTTQDKLRTNDSASEHIDSTQVLESWKNYLSSFNNTNLQPESLENGFKLFKNITSILQRDEDSSGQSSKSENQSSEQSNQEANTQDIPDSDRIGSADISAHDNFMNSSFTAQESEDSSSSYSFKGWNNDETLQNCDLKSPNFTTHDEAIETTEGFSNSADESTEVNASKENSAEENKRTLRCKHCRRSFKIRKDLALHLRTHHGHAQNYCISCRYQFNTKKEFNTHIKIHKAEKIHPCSMCEFVSHSFYGLKKHLAVHQSTSSKSGVVIPKVELLDVSKENSEDPPSSNSRSKRPACSTCMVVFRNEFYLQRHKDRGCKGIPKSKKGYHCPMCMYIGSRLRSVEDHLAGHTGDYRFRCSYCPYQCSRNNLLKEHMSKRHPEFI